MSLDTRWQTPADSTPLLSAAPFDAGETVATATTATATTTTATTAPASSATTARTGPSGDLDQDRFVEAEPPNALDHLTATPWCPTPPLYDHRTDAPRPEGGAATTKKPIPYRSAPNLIDVFAGERSVFRQQQGQAVKDVQMLLNLSGGTKVKEDGLFGPKTEAAVKAYQKANGLLADGKVGSETLLRLSGAAVRNRTD